MPEQSVLGRLVLALFSDASARLICEKEGRACGVLDEEITAQDIAKWVFFSGMISAVGRGFLVAKTGKGVALAVWDLVTGPR